MHVKSSEFVLNLYFRSSFDLTCSTTNIRQVESLTPAMWLISMGTNSKA